MELHHVGVATPDAAALAATLGELFDLRVVHEERVEDLQVTLLDAGAAHLELLEPTEREKTVARFLDRRGPGLHHVALATPDLGGVLAALRHGGVETVDDEPRPGAWGHRVAFLHPDATGGMLVELVEDAA
jgi:methylmalonyl-CoA/ethylmalonyl-CoA epimerase